MVKSQILNFLFASIFESFFLADGVFWVISGQNTVWITFMFNKSLQTSTSILFLPPHLPLPPPSPPPPPPPSLSASSPRSRWCARSTWCSWGPWRRSRTCPADRNPHQTKLFRRSSTGCSSDKAGVHLEKQNIYYIWRHFSEFILIQRQWKQ